MRVVILGNGPAAIAGAEAARDLAPDCEITIVSAEPTPSYSPCPLAEYVEGSVPRERLFLRDAGFYRDRRVRALLGRRAVGIDPEAPRVRLDGGDCLEFDRLLVATGARAVLPPVPGLAGTPGVFPLKTLADADAILGRLARSRRAVVIGAGLIGLEAAQALRRRGLLVTVVEALPQVLPQMLDADLAALVEDRLRAHGVEVRLASPVEAVVGGPAGVTGVVAGGRELPCELVICAAGVRPELDLVASAGIATATGILVNDRMETSRPGVHAAGDVVEAFAVDGQRRLLPSWPNAVNGGRVAGHNLVGVPRRFRGLEAVNVVRVFDVPVASFGARAGERALVRREGTAVRKLAIRDGRIVGGQLVGDVDRTGLWYELMKKGRDVTPFGDALLDRGFGVGRLLQAPARRAPWIAA